MKTSVVISTYNGEKYLKPQLESIRKQTVQPDEVLIKDDRSTDNTVNLVKKFIQENNLKNWKIIINQRNLGWRHNFMEALWQSSGDIVFFCDQDDIWRNDKLSIMIRIMKAHPEINLLTSNYREFYENGKQKIGPWANDRILKKVELKKNYLLVKSPGCTHCIRRKLIDLSKKYWQADYAHDALMWRLALFSGSLYTYTDTLIDWRKHDSSTFAKESRDLKTIAEKKKWIKIAECFQLTLKSFLANDVKKQPIKAWKVLNCNDQWLNTRNHFYQAKNIFTGIKLAFYWNCYPRYRQYLGDWYLIFIKRK